MSQSRHRDAFFLKDAKGRSLFCIHTQTTDIPRGAVLFVPPFAEEMNRSRRMVALASKALVDSGWNVLQLDLFGCGDSDGDFADASWSIWLENVTAAMQWLESRHPAPIVLWGLRAGCLLIADWLKSMEGASCSSVLLWQPVASGRQHLTHFLRLKALNDQSEPEPGGVVKAARARLQMGGHVEVAGYGIGAGVADGIEHADLDLPEGFGGKVGVIEVSAKSPSAVSPVIANRVAQWQERRIPVSTDVVQGPAFWLTQEVTVAPSMLEATVSMLGVSGT